MKLSKDDYAMIAKRGCKWEESEDNHSEGDCGHWYRWTCDDCPVMIERNKINMDGQKLR